MRNSVSRGRLCHLRPSSKELVGNRIIEAHSVTFDSLRERLKQNGFSEKECNERIEFYKGNQSLLRSHMVKGVLMAQQNRLMAVQEKVSQEIDRDETNHDG